MARVRCTCYDCKNISVYGNCLLKTIKLDDCYIRGRNGGLRHFQKCKCYEKAEEIEEIQKELKGWFKNGVQ